MAEYIEVDLLRDEILYDPDYDGDTVNHFLSIVDSQPTADVVEVKHGAWQFNYNEHRHLTSCSCSVCKRSVKEHAPYIGYVICPYCGAKMDLKEGATNA